MSTLRDDLLPIVQDGRALIQDFGLRQSRLVLRTRTWSTGEVRFGTSTDVDLEILPRPRIKETGDEVLKVDRITPQNTSGGYTMAQLNPPDTAGVEIIYVVTAPNGTKDYSLAAIEDKGNFGYSMLLNPLNRPRPF